MSQAQAGFEAGLILSGQDLYHQHHPCLPLQAPRAALALALTQWDQETSPRGPPSPMQGPAGGCLCLFPLSAHAALLSSLTATCLTLAILQVRKFAVPKAATIPISPRKQTPLGPASTPQGSTYQANPVTGYLPFSFLLWDWSRTQPTLSLGQGRGSLRGARQEAATLVSSTKHRIYSVKAGPSGRKI